MSMRIQLLTATLFAFFMTSCAVYAQEAPPLSGQELSDFLGPVSPNLIRWTREQSIDFELFNGEAMPPLSGHVYFYLGGHPDFQREPNSTPVNGQLGKHRVTWYRSLGENGSIVQHALLHLNWYWRVDIWIRGPKQSDVDQLIGIVSNLPLFNGKPPPTLLGDSVVDDLLDAHVSLYLLLVFCAPALFLVGFWLLKRRLRRFDSKLSRRLSWLLTYSFGCFLLLAAGFAFVGYQTFSMPVIAGHAVWLTLLYGSALAFFFSLILPILTLIAHCRGR